MLTVMIFVFLIGYLCIALEHPLKGEQSRNSPTDRNNTLGFIHICCT